MALFARWQAKSPHFRILALALLVAALLAAPGKALAQDDGARAYMLAPNNVHLLSLYGLFIRGNQTADPATSFGGAHIDVNLALLQYTHPVAVAGNAGALFAIVPVGRVNGSLDIGPLSLSGDSGGLGDIQVGGVFGLIGLPSLSPQEYASYKPGFSLGILGKLVAPTGEYSSDKILNVGANRWAFKVGAPMTYYVGQSMLDPSLMTFELLPAATFFTDNNDPFGASNVALAPLYTIEGHITRNLGRSVWVSVDALYTFGGETTTDGVSDQNAKSAFGLGGTLGVNLSSNYMLKLTYGQSVSHNENGSDGKFLRIVASAVF